MEADLAETAQARRRSFFDLLRIPSISAQPEYAGACRQAAEWGLPQRDMYVSVNVSARQLDGDSLVRELRAALGGVAGPQNLVIAVQ